MPLTDDEHTPPPPQAGMSAQAYSPDLNSTALGAAVTYHQLELADMLLVHGADPGAVPEAREQGGNILHTVCRAWHVSDINPYLSQAEVQFQKVGGRLEGSRRWVCGMRVPEGPEGGSMRGRMGGGRGEGRARTSDGLN